MLNGIAGEMTWFMLTTSHPPYSRMVAGKCLYYPDLASYDVQQNKPLMHTCEGVKFSNMQIFFTNLYVHSTMQYKKIK